MLNAFRHLLCSKLCRHNQQVPMYISFCKGLIGYLKLYITITLAFCVHCTVLTGEIDNCFKKFFNIWGPILSLLTSLAWLSSALVSLCWCVSLFSASSESLSCELTWSNCALELPSNSYPIIIQHGIHMYNNSNCGILYMYALRLVATPSLCAPTQLAGIATNVS